MAAVITLQVRKMIIQNGGYVNYAPNNKAIGVASSTIASVRPFADTVDTSIYAVVVSQPVAGEYDQYYCAQTVATIIALT